MSYARLGKTKDIKAISAPIAVVHRSSPSTSARRRSARREVQPGGPGRHRAPGDRLRDRPRPHRQIGARGTAFAGHGLLPDFYKAFYTKPRRTIRSTSTRPTRCSTRRAGRRLRRHPHQGRPEAVVRPLRPLGVAPEHPVRAARARDDEADRRRLQGPDRERGQARPRSPRARSRARWRPDFDTFIWGWGGDPYDPGLLLDLLTTKAIGGSSDSFYSNPEYDKLYDQQTGEFDQASRKAIVAKMIALSQRDLPYIVLTVDPTLQAYRTRQARRRRRAVSRAGGDITCDQVGYADDRRHEAGEPGRPAAAAATAARTG